MKKTIILFSIIFIFTGTLRASEETLLFRFKGTGVDEELIDAAEQIFGSALTREGKYPVSSAVNVVGNVQCYDLSCAVDYAEEAGFPKAVTGSLTRLGGKYIVDVQLVDVKSREVDISVDAVSETEEDLDVVLKRLAKSISSGREMDETAELGLVTESESRPDRRRTSFTSKGLRAGFMWPSVHSFGKTDRMTAVDFVVQHDMKDYFLSGRGGIKWGDNISLNLTILETKIGRYLSRGDFSPFISGGIGIQYNRAKIEKKDGTFYEDTGSGTGLSLCGGVGLAAFRTYDFQFQLDIDYFIVFSKVENGSASGEEYPQGIIFTFCIKH
ncbi:MAG TPA: hypothetical protein VKO43_06360 [Candidatus Krumholzibacteriaceae bacterium]|nr:hypothetical protein [Candidatus Krumholzibacteriaceae bacterium]